MRAFRTWNELLQIPFQSQNLGIFLLDSWLKFWYYYLNIAMLTRFANFTNFASTGYSIRKIRLSDLSINPRSFVLSLGLSFFSFCGINIIRQTIILSFWLLILRASKRYFFTSIQERWFSHQILLLLGMFLWLVLAIFFMSENSWWWHFTIYIYFIPEKGVPSSSNFVWLKI